MDESAPDVSFLNSQNEVSMMVQAIGKMVMNLKGRISDAEQISAEAREQEREAARANEEALGAKKVA